MPLLARNMPNVMNTLDQAVMDDGFVAAPRSRGQAPPVVITGRQIKMARAALDWSASKLATEAKVGWRTVARAEASEGVPPNMNMSTLTKIRNALEAAGVEFLQRTNGGVGVRMRR
jgi:hypothetical protein